MAIIQQDFTASVPVPGITTPYSVSSEDTKTSDVIDNTTDRYVKLDLSIEAGFDSFAYVYFLKSYDGSTFDSVNDSSLLLRITPEFVSRTVVIPTTRFGSLPPYFRFVFVVFDGTVSSLSYTAVKAEVV